MKWFVFALSLICGGEVFAAPTSLIATGSVWKYLDNGSDQGAAWVGTNFNDSTWASGPAELGYGDGTDGRPEATVVGYGGNANNKYITTYFRHTFTVADHTAFSNLLVRLLRDDGGIVYLNGAEVFRSNMPLGPVNFRTLAAGNAADDGAAFQAKAIDPSLLRNGPNVLAVEIHQNTNTSSDISFELELIGNPTIVPPGVTMLRWPVADGGNGHYYEAIGSSGINWHNASTAATNRGGYLATVTSAQENQFVFNLVRDNTNLWIRRPSGDGWGPWLGAVQPPGSVEPAGGWAWVTGESFNYQHWNIGEPNDTLGTEDRLFFIGEKVLVGDTWNDSTGSNGVIRGYVVEYPSNLEPAPLVELLFNETGTNASNTGRSGVPAVLFNSANVVTDLHSDVGLGLSGLLGDRALDNTTATGMGSGGTGGRATQPYDEAVDGLLSLTLQGWFRVESTVGSNARFFAKQGSGTGFLFLAPSGGTLSLEINGSSSTMSSAQFSEVGQWIFFAVTYDGSTTANNVKFYKGTPTNGVTLIETRTLNLGRAATNSSGVSFANANGLQRPIDGLVDNLRIFGSKTDNRGALTPAQLEWFRNKDVQNLTDPAVLSIARTNLNIRLSWAAYPGSFHLETTTNFALPESWQPVTDAPTIINDQNVLLLPTQATFEAFRLAR